MWGHLNSVELLVNSDADIESCDEEGKTAVSNITRLLVLYHLAFPMGTLPCSTLSLRALNKTMGTPMIIILDFHDHTVHYQ